MAKPKFVNCLIIRAPRENAPDFIKGSISTKREELIAWLQAETEEWINLDIKVSRKTGKWYAQVNDWKPEKKSDGWEEVKNEVRGALYDESTQEDQVPLEDIPF